MSGPLWKLIASVHASASAVVLSFVFCLCCSDVLEGDPDMD
jgi:hypothetical protein